MFQNEREIDKYLNVDIDYDVTDGPLKSPLFE